MVAFGGLWRSLALSLSGGLRPPLAAFGRLSGALWRPLAAWRPLWRSLALSGGLWRLGGQMAASLALSGAHWRSLWRSLAAFNTGGPTPRSLTASHPMSKKSAGASERGY